MTNTERYRADPQYRARQVARTQANHAKNLASPTYRKLVVTRKTIWQVKERVSECRLKIKALQQRLQALARRKEELELAFGKERAERKRARPPEGGKHK
jgi:hypothetical protein